MVGQIPDFELEVVKDWVSPPSQYPIWYTKQWAYFWSDENEQHR